MVGDTCPDLDWSPGAPRHSLEKRRQLPSAPPSADKHNGPLPCARGGDVEVLGDVLSTRGKGMVWTVRSKLLLSARWVVLGQGAESSPRLHHETCPQH